MLERCFATAEDDAPTNKAAGIDVLFKPRDDESYSVFKTLYATWCFNPVAALSLCLLAQVP